MMRANTAAQSSEAAQKVDVHIVELERDEMECMVYILGVLPTFRDGIPHQDMYMLTPTLLTTSIAFFDCFKTLIYVLS